MLYISFPRYTSLPDVHTKECSHIYVLIQSTCSNLHLIPLDCMSRWKHNYKLWAHCHYEKELAEGTRNLSLTTTNPHLNKVLQTDDKPLIHFLCMERYPNVSPWIPLLVLRQCVYITTADWLNHYNFSYRLGLFTQVQPLHHHADAKRYWFEDFGLKWISTSGPTLNIETVKCNDFWMHYHQT